MNEKEFIIKEFGITEQVYYNWKLGRTKIPSYVQKVLFEKKIGFVPKKHKK